MWKKVGTSFLTHSVLECDTFNFKQFKQIEQRALWIEFYFSIMSSGAQWYWLLGAPGSTCAVRFLGLIPGWLINNYLAQVCIFVCCKHSMLEKVPQHSRQIEQRNENEAFEWSHPLHILFLISIKVSLAKYAWISFAPTRIWHFVVFYLLFVPVGG